ncbi:Hsp20/alpha crystallin family protein [Roseburia hominis]|uniref:Hsp20/alpha crystallin family protein n=1 Tax=Roseburia hominis TaxID=301301 RepID=UPI001F173EBF|nr:Hsp20/alpha crystallin family protein [Roseburia hominis]
MLVPNIFGENLFDGLFDVDDYERPTRNIARYTTPNTSIMRTDIRETASTYELDIDLPGYKKEDVQAELKDGYLTITATTQSKEEKADTNGRYIRRERYSGSCSRAFYVGEDVTQEDIHAKFENGILKLSILKKEAKPKVEENHFINIEG